MTERRDSHVPDMAAPPRIPGRGWYVLGLVLFLAGMAAMGAFLFQRLSHMGDALTQIVVPGERTLALVPGDYTIFHESRTVVDGRIYDSPGLGGLGVTVASSEGEPIALAPVSISGRYSIAGRTGFAVFDFTIAKAGDYVVAGSYPAGVSGPETVLAVASGFTSSLLTTIGGALAFAFTGAGLFIAIALTVFLKRRRAGLRF